MLILYYQLLQFGQQMVENGRLSSILGLWLPFLVFALGSTYAFRVANSGLGQDPFSAFFRLLDDAWLWLRLRWATLVARRRPA